MDHPGVPADAIRILERWQVEYRFTMVWQRDVGIQTQTPRHFDVEFVVVGAKGDPKFINSLSRSMGGEAEVKMGFNGACGASLAGPSVKPGEF